LFINETQNNAPVFVHAVLTYEPSSVRSTSDVVAYVVVVCIGQSCVFSSLPSSTKNNCQTVTLLLFDKHAREGLRTARTID
jgi:hypothetical protein